MLEQGRPEEIETGLSQREFDDLLQKAGKVTGLREVLNGEHLSIDKVIQHLNERRKGLKETFRGGQLRGVFADEEEACRRLPQLLQTGEVSILDLRAMFPPEEAQAVTESAQARRTLLLWTQIGSLFRRGR